MDARQDQPPTVISRRALPGCGLVAVALLPIACCAVVHVRVIVVNVSSTPLSNIRIIVSGVVDEVGTLQPGEERAVWVKAQGESGVTVTYSSPGRGEVSSGSLGYLEPGYRGRITFRIGQEGVEGIDWKVRVR